MKPWMTTSYLSNAQVRARKCYYSHYASRWHIHSNLIFINWKKLTFNRSDQTLSDQFVFSKTYLRIGIVPMLKSTLIFHIRCHYSLLTTEEDQVVLNLLQYLCGAVRRDSVLMPPFVYANDFRPHFKTGSWNSVTWLCDGIAVLIFLSASKCYYVTT